MSENKWYTAKGEQNDIVVSSRIRLARNLKETYLEQHHLQQRLISLIHQLLIQI